MSEMGSSSTGGKCVDGKTAEDGEIHVDLSSWLCEIVVVVIRVLGSRGRVHGASLLSG